MPLVIVVCLLLSIIYVLIDSANKDAKRISSIQKGIKRTNLALEEELVKQYYEYEKDINKAVELAHKYLIKHNFVPCSQPKDYDVKKRAGYARKDSVTLAGAVYDSHVIRMIQDGVNTYNRNNPGQEIPDDYVYYMYDEFVKTCSFRELNKKLKTLKHTYPVGTMVNSTFHGYCTIVDRSIEHDYRSVYYTIESIEDGKRYVNVNSWWIDKDVNNV